MSRPPVLLEVGRVSRPHGLRGEVVVELVTNRTERLAPHSVLEADRGPLEVLGARPHGGSDRWVVSFTGVHDRTGAEALRGQVLRAAPLRDEEILWVHELVGAEVVDGDGSSRGRVIEVQANPASDLLVLDTGALVPLTFVVEHRAGRVRIDAPPGLFDL